MRYDPLTAPDAEAWHELDESERIDLIAQYHRRAKIRLPNDQVHAAIHMIVENQITLGDELPVQSTLERLIGEGLDRHEAIHAIGEVLVEHMYSLLQTDSDEPTPPEANDPYYAALDVLAAEHRIKNHNSDSDDDYLIDVDDVPPEQNSSLAQLKPYPHTGRNDPCPCGSGKNSGSATYIERP